MKLLMCTVFLYLACFFSAAAQTTPAAAPTAPAAPAGESSLWEISMMPNPSTEEREQARWSVLLENEIGIYAYDMSSLELRKESETTPPVEAAVLTKTLFTNKALLKKINAQYAGQLRKKEKVQYCAIRMIFNLKDRTYAVPEMEIFSDKGRQIARQTKPLAFVPVPADTFAEAMLELCQQAAGVAPAAPGA